MTPIVAIDPGSAQSAWIAIDGQGTPLAFGMPKNAELLEQLRRRWLSPDVGVLGPAGAEVVVEWMAPRGMPTSAQELETAYIVGRIAEALHPLPVNRLTRLRVKMAICGRASATDANIHAALIDRYGGTGGKAAAVGLKKSPGPLYGIANDVWAALALGCAWQDGAR